MNIWKIKTLPWNGVTAACYKLEYTATKFLNLYMYVYLSLPTYEHILLCINAAQYAETAQSHGYAPLLLRTLPTLHSFCTHTSIYTVYNTHSHTHTYKYIHITIWMNITIDTHSLLSHTNKHLVIFPRTRSKNVLRDSILKYPTGR